MVAKVAGLWSADHSEVTFFSVMQTSAPIRNCLVCLKILLFFLTLDMQIPCSCGILQVLFFRSELNFWQGLSVSQLPCLPSGCGLPTWVWREISSTAGCESFVPLPVQDWLVTFPHQTLCLCCRSISMPCQFQTAVPPLCTCKRPPCLQSRNWCMPAGGNVLPNCEVWTHFYLFKKINTGREES